ncbi:MAG: hypothetical protein CVU40_12340 [Chloroflexi bacterium HGW-Chloroflexi-2]|jgi:hypothetical protein|nr:MAG: hypothetical protein CVU40_12340 [Chloroflexi bacterium HGW-Chloroflexi-2]
MDNRSGCLVGLLKLFLLDKVFDWLQSRFGFGQGCMGCGCGVILLIAFLIIAGAIIFDTNWFSLF